MRILVAPLNWGLGHASRCVPIIQNLLDEGNEVILGGDGESLMLLQKHFPNLGVVKLPSLELEYGRGKSQVWAMLKAIPKIVRWSLRDKVTLHLLLMGTYFDKVISDNRFGFHSKDTYSIYITHQIMIKMPKALRFLEPVGYWMHKRIIKKYDECWIPDFAEQPNLSGDLAHKYPLPANAKFIGPLSRFTPALEPSKCCFNNEQNSSFSAENSSKFDVVAILSGLEPQRTIFERQIVEKYEHSDKKVLVVRGKMSQSMSKTQHANFTFVPFLNDSQLLEVMQNAEIIVARSGYSTIMDLQALNMLDKAELMATPGQTEQEYLANYLLEKKCIKSS